MAKDENTDNKLGVAIALTMPREGVWVSVCLVLMALPLLITMMVPNKRRMTIKGISHTFFLSRI